MSKFSFLPAVLAGASVALVSSALPAGAISFNLAPNITNVSDNYTDISNQFGLTLTDDGLAIGKVKFHFTNIGSISSSITDIYFGKNTNPGFSTFLQTEDITIEDSGQGVSFAADPNDTKAGGGIKWESVFSAEANSPTQPQGVNPGEFISFTFNLQSGKSIADVYNGFSGGNLAPLAIAFHVQGLPGGKSDWYGTSNVTPKDIPEPFTMLGTAAALGFGRLFQRQRNKQQKAQAKA